MNIQTSSPEEKNLIQKIEIFYRSINTQEISEKDKNTYTKFIQLKGRAYDFYFEKNYPYSNNYRTKKQLLRQAIQNAKSIQNADKNSISEALKNSLIFADAILKNK